MTNLLFYREQAELQQAEADGATLANARARSQSAADAWTALADQQERRQTRRDRLERASALQEPSENPDRGHGIAGAAPIRRRGARR
jgi:hypothetical protein